MAIAGPTAATAAATSATSSTASTSSTAATVATAAATIPGIFVGMAVVAAVAGVHLAVGPGLQGQVVSTNAGRKIQRSILFKVIWFRGYTGV